jgi:hypothetical protein
MILDLPSAFLVDRHAGSRFHVVADDVHFIVIRTDQVLQDCTDDGLHAAGENHGRDVIFQRPLEVLVEPRVQLDVFHKQVNAIWERFLDRVQHFAEGVACSD